MWLVIVLSKRDKIPKGFLAVDTTSRSKNWSKGLSPFYLGPVNLYNGYTALNVENAWQYSKVYKNHINELTGEIDKSYYEWAIDGWNSSYASRYPMGKGAIPLFSLWNNERLGYIDARKKIYIPAYAKAVVNSNAFKKLKQMHDDDEDIALIDFDGYNHKNLNMSYNDVVNCTSRKMGHAFVIAMILDEVI